jgi:hypothetical protein
MSDLRVSFPQPCGEPWEAMAPAGCARICSACDKGVHDLSQYDLEAAEALLRSGSDVCVRARIGTDGTVALRPGPSRSPRRMVVAAAMGAALLAAGQPAFAGRNGPGGAITGQVSAYGFPVRITATDESGNIFRTRVKRNGRYRLRHLPAGTYSLKFEPTCGEEWTVENVAVGEGVTEVPMGSQYGGCIVVGLLRIEDGSTG